MKKKPKPIAKRDLRRNRCYSRYIDKDMLLQIFDRPAPANGPGHVKIEIYLRPNLVRKHRKLIDALFAWAKDSPA
jgi:hypothetical protein